MPEDDRFRRQVALLVRILQLVAEEKCFALKGGTAINLFIRNLPRLSVDIDLAWLPVAGRAESLGGIEAALRRIRDRVEASFPSARVQEGTRQEEGTINKLFVREHGTQIKIEVTPVLRGCAFAPEVKPVSSIVEERFGFAAIQVVSFADLEDRKALPASARCVGSLRTALPVRNAGGSGPAFHRATVRRRPRRAAPPRPVPGGCGGPCRAA